MFGFTLFCLAIILLFACVVPFTKQNRLRTSIVTTYLFLSLYIHLSTEILSAIHAIQRSNILVVWSILCCLCIVFFWATNGIASWKHILKRRPLHSIFQELWKHKVFSLMLLWILGYSFIEALYYPPNNYDAMIYHMTRIMQWLQNHSLSYIPCNEERLNYQFPLAEDILLHLQVLFQKDTFANLVQWNAYVISLLTMSLIASEIGFRRSMQWSVVFISATIPNVILQSHSAQNDVVAGSYLLLFVYYMLRLAHAAAPTRKLLLLAGLSMGLSLVAKGTNFLFTAIIGVSFGLWILLKAKKNWLPVALNCSLIVVIAIALLSPILYRNLQYYHTMLPSSPETVSYTYFPTKWCIQELIRTYAQNLSLHLSLPNDRWNWFVQNAFVRMFGDSFLMSSGFVHKVNIVFWIHQDCMGDFIHLILSHAAILVILIALFRNTSLFKTKTSVVLDPQCNPVIRDVYWFTAISFCTMITIFSTLCYSPWNARFHGVIFCLFSLSIVYMFELFPRIRVLRPFLILLLFANAVWVLHSDPSNPIPLREISNLSVQQFRKNQQNNFPHSISVQHINHLKAFLQQNGIRKILHHDWINQRDYTLYKGLAGPLQTELAIQRTAYNINTEYDTPYLLVSSHDRFNTSYSESFVLSIPGKQIYTSKFFTLFDLSKARDSLSIPTIIKSPDAQNLLLQNVRMESTNTSFVVSTDIVFSIQNPTPAPIYITLFDKNLKLNVESYRYSFGEGVTSGNLSPQVQGKAIAYPIVLPENSVTSNIPILLHFEISGNMNGSVLNPSVFGGKNPIFSHISFSQEKSTFEGGDSDQNNLLQ